MSDREWTRRAFLRASALGSGALLLGCSSLSETRNLTFNLDTISYGPDPMQVGELKVPVISSPRPVAMLLHGGYWANGFTRTEMSELADDLAREGYATWNVDYRRVGDPGGGWLGTTTDVAVAMDKLADLAQTKNLDLSRVVTIGHSAGAQLALWAASRRPDRADLPGGPARVQAKACISLSGVVDLVASSRYTKPGLEADLGRAVLNFMGGSPEQHPDRYALTSPLALLPIGVNQLLLHGSMDNVVPVEQSRSYVAAAEQSGDPTQFIEVSNLDHFDVVKTNRNWWDKTLTWMSTAVGDPLT